MICEVKRYYQKREGKNKRKINKSKICTKNILIRIQIMVAKKFLREKNFLKTEF